MSVPAAAKHFSTEAVTVGERGLRKRVKLMREKLERHGTCVLGKRPRDEDTLKPPRQQRQPSRTIRAAATAPPLTDGNTDEHGKRAWRRNSAQVSKSDDCVGAMFDAWNDAFKQATLEALKERKLDEQFLKISGGRKRGPKDGRRSISMTKAGLL